MQERDYRLAHLRYVVVSFLLHNVSVCCELTNVSEAIRQLSRHLAFKVDADCTLDSAHHAAGAWFIGTATRYSCILLN